ncbi:phage tail tape measure protein [Heyndrickxia coagulans]|uniref:phage tail tape measure protein n=1 Tax=Heyndrickxia coagulans TaxID=1398 RepID=UPI0022363861|nr:phage tail tape measure protein [Heyndrickxia coagulans]UZH06403.1 phage tail tape measure protein [Heyndrickxia coagulans]
MSSRIKSKVDDTTKSLHGFKSSVEKVKDTIKTVGAAYLASKLYDIGKAAIATGMEFDKQMSGVQAISGATAGQFKALRQQAIDLGASTTKSASEVAAGQLELAKSGFTVKQIMAAMPGVISASTASGEDMARTAEVMTAALNSFGLKASEATHVADVLAQAANDSAADINDLGYTFKYAAAPAHMLGISMEELSAATEIMSNAGIKGETAGTSLRAALLRLADPPKAAGNMLDRLGVSITDAHGKMLPFSNIIGQLHDKTKNMANAEKTMALSAIFGTDAVSGMMDVVEAGPTKLNKLTASLKDSDGASKRAADTMSDNLAGAVKQLKGAAESASISVSDTLKPAVKAGVHVVTDLVAGFNDLSPSAKKMVVWGTIVVGGVLPVAYGIYKVRQAVKSVREIMAGAKSFFSNYRSELAKTGQQAAITAAEINQVNEAVEATETGTTTGAGTSGKKGTKTKSGKAAASAAGEVAETAAQEVAEATSQTTKKSGIVSKIGGRIGKGMTGSKVLPVVGTLLSATQLIGMNNSNAGEKLGGFSGSLAGGAAGAAIGSAIAPGIGTAIGGAAGSIAGSKFGEKFGAAVQKKWPGIQKSIDGFVEKHPIFSKLVAITAPIAGLVLYGHKAAQSLKKDFKDPLDTTVNFGKTVHSTTAKAVNSYMNLESKSKVQLGLLAANGDKYSKSARDSINKNFSSMVTLVQKSFDKTKKSTQKNLSTLVKNGLLSEKDMKNIENKQKASQKRQLKAVQESSKNDSNQQRRL